MRWFSDLPFRRKLTLATMLTSLTALLCASVAFVAYDVVTFRADMIRDIGTLGEVIGDNSTAELTFGDAKAATGTLAALRAMPQIEMAVLYGYDGKPFAKYDGPGGADPLAPARRPEPGIRFEAGHLVLSRPILLDGDLVGSLYMVSGLDAMRARWRRYAAAIALVALISSAVIIFLSLRLQRLVLSPLVRLAEAAASIGAGNLDTRLEITTHDEVGLLAEAFNRMVANLGGTTVSKDYFDNIIRSLVDALVVVRTDFTIEMVNSALTRLTGYSEQELIGRRCKTLFAEDGRADSRFEQLTRDGVLNDVEVGVITTDRRRVDVRLSASVMYDPSGRVRGYVAVMQDITERKRTEEELSQYYGAVAEARIQAEQQAEALGEVRNAALAAARLKSEFLANMSHEIRTPMNGVIGMTDLALGTALDPEQREYLETIKVSADSLMTILNDILDFSKVEAGRMELESIPFSLGHNLRDTLKTLAFRAYQKGLELNCRVAPGVPDALLGDPGRLRQILINLVGNAIKFTEHGEILVDVAAEWEPSDREIALHYSVADTGIGIPEDKRQLIFDPFTQVDGSTTRKFGGTGLGLAIAGQLVELMNGRIWVESETGQGSTFHFIVRLALPQERPATASHAPAERFEGVRVLVVDDNATNCRLCGELFRGWKMRSSEVRDAPAALAALEKARSEGDPFALVLLDALMPGMDGFELAERIRSRPDLASTRLILLTSAGRPGDAARCRENGVAGYLTKPVFSVDLIEAVRRLLAAPPGGAARELVTQHTIRESRRSLRLLLAEDSPVNRLVATRVLQKVGHEVVGVEDGRCALAALESERFDLVLMDVQMPEMDGFEATAALRARERRQGGHMPVIALTAHALKGDAERCIDAGMDGVVTKPFQVEALLAEIERLVGGAGAPVARTPAVPPPSGTAVLDIPDVLARVGSDAGLLTEIVELFHSDAPKMLEELRNNIGSGDAASLEKTAHRLKGALGTLAALAAREVAEKLETLGREGNVLAAGPELTALEREIHRLEPELAALVARNGIAGSARAGEGP
jgi:PAS domain S-box-containing protein